MTGLLKRPAVWWLAFVSWAVVLWWLSSRPGSGALPAIPHLDKVLHAGYFFLGGVLFQTALSCGERAITTRTRIILGLLVALSVGLMDEYHQTFTPGRSGNDPWDILADVVGGCLAAWIMTKRKR